MANSKSESSGLPNLDSLAEILNANSAAFQPIDKDSLLPPADGISLLDVKSELLLAYIQDLVSLIILRLRSSAETDGHSTQENFDLASNVVKQLVELRVYTEKGVRPLENRLKYQIDKAVKTADDFQRSEALKRDKKLPKPRSKRKNVIRADGHDGGYESSKGSGSELESDHESEEASGIDELSYRPNPAAFVRQPLVNAGQDVIKESVKSTPKGAYKPPRIQATAMPDPDRRDERRTRPPKKSALMDEYIESELSGAPMAQPSIGSGNTIMNKGRNTMGRKEREDEKERREYEETNFVRLPGESKAERKKRSRIERHRGKAEEYGGEDLSGLGSLSDRIALVTRGNKEDRGVLARGRKRSAEGSGMGGQGRIGESFEKRRKVLEGREAKRKGRHH